MNAREPITQFSPPSLVVFGPSTSWPTEDFLHHVRQVLLDQPRLSKFTDAIRGLPQSYPPLVEAEPKLSKTPGLNYLESLSLWLETGCLLPTGDSQQSRATGQCDPIPPNILLSPLTVIIHIVQYFEFTNVMRDFESRAQAHKSPILVQGFCTGLLVAQAVACSSSENLFVENASRALRLAVAIGAFIDLNGIWSDPPYKTSCFVARWSSVLEKEQLENIVQASPGVSRNISLENRRIDLRHAGLHISHQG
jgi:hypothetical protein